MTRARAARVACGAVLVALVVARADAQGRQVMLTAADGVPVAATVYEAAARPAPAVVLVHMLQRTRDDWRPVAEQLQREGITALTLDLRGHGGSGGTAAVLTAMTADLTAAIDWLALQPGVRPDALGIAGASLGANLALVVAAADGRVRTTALVSPSTDYRGVSLSGVMRRYGARPALLVASAQDPLALRTIRELAEDTAGIRGQYVDPVAAHGTVLVSRSPDLARTLVDWLRRTLLF